MAASKDEVWATAASPLCVTLGVIGASLPLLSGARPAGDGVPTLLLLLLLLLVTPSAVVGVGESVPSAAGVLAMSVTDGSGVVVAVDDGAGASEPADWPAAVGVLPGSDG